MQSWRLSCESTREAPHTTDLARFHAPRLGLTMRRQTSDLTGLVKDGGEKIRPLISGIFYPESFTINQASKSHSSAPQHTRKLFRHRLAMLRPFAFLKLGPIRRGGEAFAIRCAELELHRQAAFEEGGVGGEGEAVLELPLGFGGVVDVAERDRAQGFSARSCEACARGGEKGMGSSPWWG